MTRMSSAAQVHSARKLRVMLEYQWVMKSIAYKCQDHSHIVRISFYQLERLSSVQHSLTQEGQRVLVAAFNAGCAV